MFDMNQLNDMMTKARDMQKKLQEERAALAIHGDSAGGKVRVVINGNKEMTKLEIDPEINGDPRLLADFILAALSAAYARADAQSQNQLSDMMSGLDLSKIGNLFRS